MSKKVFVFLAFVFLNADLLSTLKQKELNYDEKINKEDYKVNIKSWLNPVILQYSINQDNSQEVLRKTKTFTISIDQPIFKSGAIYYSIKYAKYLKNLNYFQNQKTKKDLIKQAYDLAIDYKKTLLNKQILLLKIRNAKIDVERKKEEFLNGTLDSSFLDNAILSLNNLKLSLADLENNLENIKLSFANISNLDIEKVKLPKIKLISKKDYIQNNIQTKISKSDILVKNALYKMTRGDNLLSISLQASYTSQNIKYNNKFPNDNLDYYNVGISFKLPLFFNALNKIEKSKLNYLKSKISLEDTKKTLLNEYKKAILNLKNIEKKAKVYKENIKIYENLIQNTIENIKAGSKTNLDLEVLENSLKIMKINLKILKLEKTKILLDLYSKIF